jgi:predicted ester cyclase
VTSRGPDQKAAARAVAEEVISAGRLDLVDELFTPGMARRARRWIEPFLASFHDVRMEVVQLVEEGDTVVGRFSCSGTHAGPWHGIAPTGRRFEAVAEVYFFGFEDGRIASMWGLEDTASRLDQLGIASSDLPRA